MRWAMSAHPEACKHVQIRILNTLDKDTLIAALNALDADILLIENTTIDVSINAQGLYALSHHEGVVAVVEGRDISSQMQ